MNENDHLEEDMETSYPSTGEEFLSMPELVRLLAHYRRIVYEQLYSAGPSIQLQSLLGDD